MVKMTIDDVEIEVDPGLSVMQACEQVGVEVPRFCYHERLSVAGNCRMCLVEMERSPKPIASCAMPVGEGMVIRTNTPLVKKAREGVMEFLLINHPLDCPICDQGGECDLQDQAMAYGVDRSRFIENKRAVKDIDIGPLVATNMTRCISCTRCVRFAAEVAGVEELGSVGRGEDAEIGTYVEKALSSEMSGNIVDLCPVGALTSKPYAFNARPWELTKTESIDVMDAVGSNIRIDVRGPEVMRVLPLLNEDVNEEWISDKTRYVVDGLRRQRLDTPYVRRDGKLEPASWKDAFAAIADRLSGLAGGKIAAIAGDQADAEAMTALKDLMAALGSPNVDGRQDGAALTADARAGYLFNTTLAGIDDADACLLIGTNPRIEAPIVNVRLRRAYLERRMPVGVIGEAVDLTYPAAHLGAGGATLKEVAAGNHDFAAVLEKAARPMLIIGQGALTGPDGGAVLAMARAIADKYGMITDGWNGFSVLHTAAARVGALDLGLVPGAGGLDVAGILAGAASGDVGAVYLLAADEIDCRALGDAFVIYQGHHGDAGAARADVILPGAAYTEKDATYVNTEGRVQRTSRAIFPPGEAREDWAILRALSDVLGKRLPYNDLDAVRARMAEINPVFTETDTVTPAPWAVFGSDGTVDDAAYASPVGNFYMTCPISRASETMAECTRTYGAAPAGRTGTDG